MSDASGSTTAPRRPVFSVAVRGPRGGSISSSDAARPIGLHSRRDETRVTLAPERIVSDQTVPMSFWDERYATTRYIYGTEPNDFLAANADRIPSGPVLCLAEGEGRNAVFLASRGHPVTAVDGSAAGLAKAEALAAARGTSLGTQVADLADYMIEPSAWSGIVSIWAHLPPALRRRVHAQVVAGLRPGGVFILEAYTPAQLTFGTGGPKDPALCMTLAALREELAGLDFVIGRECERDVIEGSGHTGRAAVVQVCAQRPTR